MDKTTIQGNQNIVIQSVTDSTLTLNVNGESHQIQHKFEEIKELIQNLQIQNPNIQYAGNIYNIDRINEANFGFITGTKVVYNQLLTKRLIEAAAPYDPSLQEWLEDAQDENLNWEQEPRLADKGKDLIISHFVGVLGVQFRKLIAIGKEDDSPLKVKKYLGQTILLVKYGLDLLNFTLLAGWWDTQPVQNAALRTQPPKILKRFFKNPLQVELSIEQRLMLFETLLQRFEAHQMPLPMPELKDFLQTHLGKTAPFRSAVGALQKWNLHLENAEISPLDCAEAELQLATMYAPLAFLVRYKMASIHAISYLQTKRSEAKYLHHYATLGFDRKQNPYIEKKRAVSQTADTDSVWIYSGEDYEKGINLMPFVLDFNALEFVQGSGSLIGFFTMGNENTVEYVILDNQSRKQLERQNVHTNEFSSEWLMETKNRIISNYNVAIGLLEQVQKMILPE